MKGVFKMDPKVAQLIETLGNSIFDTFNVPDDKLPDVENYLNELRSFGETCANYEEYQSKFNNGPMMQKYVELTSSLKPKITARQMAASAIHKNPEKAAKTVGKYLGESIVDEVDYMAQQEMDRRRRNARSDARAAVHSKIYSIPVVGGLFGAVQNARQISALGSKISKSKKSKKDSSEEE